MQQRKIPQERLVIGLKILVTLPKHPVLDTFIPLMVRRRLEELGEVEYNETDMQLTQDELRKRLRGKEVVITGWGTAKLSGEVLKGNNSLRIIAHTGGTVGNIVDDAAYDAGIKVISGNDIYAESVAEAVVACALAALRKIPDYIYDVRSGGWDSSSIWEGLLDQKIGLVGYGMTTRHLVNMLRPFRCKVLVYSSHISDSELTEQNILRASLEEIFSSCKVISLHSAMTPKNYRMIDCKLLEMLTPEQILINTARGELVDETALTQLLQQGRFRAVLDVFEQEPLPLDHPLRATKNAYLIPHRAGPTYDRRKYVTLGLADDIESFFAGRQLRLEITREYAGFMTQGR